MFLFSFRFNWLADVGDNTASGCIGLAFTENDKSKKKKRDVGKKSEWKAEQQTSGTHAHAAPTVCGWGNPMLRIGLRQGWPPVCVLLIFLCARTFDCILHAEKLFLHALNLNFPSPVTAIELGERGTARGNTTIYYSKEFSFEHTRNIQFYSVFHIFWIISPFPIQT